jgi:hypothetical protein
MSASIIGFAVVALSYQGAQAPASLFNGKDLDGWTIDAPELDKNPDMAKPFFVRDGVLVTSGKPTGCIVTKEAYENYRLSFEWRFVSQPGNNGLLIHCTTPRGFANLFPSCLEVQLMSGNAGDFYTLGQEIEVPDMEKRRVPLTGRRIPNLTDNSEKPIGQWNSMIVECRANSVLVWVNGDLVNFGYNASARKGQIAFQSEGVEVEFRKIELRSL